MKIAFSSAGDIAKLVDVLLDAEAIDLDGESFRLTRPVRFDGRFLGSDAKIEVRGRILAGLEVDCTRCLTAFDQDVDFDFRSVYVNSEHETAAAETELGDEDLDESLVEGDEIDLNETIREQLLLAVDEKQFCREDCRGLCERCGANLNLYECRCGEDEIDPRWKALGNLQF